MLGGAARLVAMVGIGAVLAGAAPARADVAVLASDLDRLRVELAGLRQIQPVQATGEPAQFARFEVRLGQLEEELRRLTGRVEQVEFNQRTLQQRFDRLLGDLDARLANLEGTASVPAAATGRDGSPPAAATPRPAVAPPMSPSEVGAGAAAAAPPAPPEGALGTIPESALLALPRVDREAATPPERGALGPQEQYDRAMELLRAGDYAGAERGLSLFLELNPDHPLAANAAYWLAETHYVRQNFAAAAAAFARNYRTYGRTGLKAEDNLLKLGMSLQGLGETDKACLTYSELADEFPDAPVHIRQALERERNRAQCA
jgi:tol-pal system protein YbgF